MKSILLALLVALSLPVPVAAATLCTLVADAGDGKILLEDGDCRSRVTPASTFKLPLAVMGFDAGILTAPDAPAWPFRRGYADWGGEDWRRTTDPTRWMKYSVVWYSQLIARDLSLAGLSRYAAGFSYGNADFSGDPGRNNGLERSWISSSLKIAPFEQVVFLRRLLAGDLAVSAKAIADTIAILQAHSPGDGWSVRGKTGSAFPRLREGTLDRSRGWGWYVGWAERSGRTLVFARLTQDEKRERVSAGLRTRDAFLAGWPDLATRLGPSR